MAQRLIQGDPRAEAEGNREDGHREVEQARVLLVRLDVEERHGWRQRPPEIQEVVGEVAVSEASPVEHEREGDRCHRGPAPETPWR